MKRGKLKQNGVHLASHEFATVRLLLDNGYDIELIPPSEIKGYRTPDLVFQGMAWEMKAPEGGSRNTIRHTIKHAAKQSNNIIIDLRRCKLPQNQAVNELEDHFKQSRRIRRMKIITKEEKILDYSK